MKQKLIHDNMNKTHAQEKKLDFISFPQYQKKLKQFLFDMFAIAAVLLGQKPKMCRAATNRFW